MNVIDVALLSVVILSLWLGWQKGAITGVADLISWVGSLLIAFFCYPAVSSFINTNAPSVGVWSRPLAFFGLLILIRVLFSVIFSRLLSDVQSQTHTSTANKAFGLVPGFINGLINAMIIAALLLVVPLSGNISVTAHNSVAVKKLSEPVQWFDAQLSPIFEEALKNPVSTRNIYPAPDETVHLPFTVTSATPKPHLEDQMIELVNKERNKQGLKSLVFDPSLVPVARSHSADMFSRGYFSHYSLEGKTVSDRLRKAGVRFLTAGENLALAPTLSTAHTGLMNSPGHRANILHKSYGKVGIGILDGGSRGLMVTQIFKN